MGVSQTAALNRGRHLYSSGRPSRWALAHISSDIVLHFVSRDLVLDGDPAPSPQKWGRAPAQFLAHVYQDQMAGWIKMALGMEVGLGSGHIVLDGDPVPPPQKGAKPPIFGPF